MRCPSTPSTSCWPKVVLLSLTGGKDDNGNDIVWHVKVGDKVLISKYGGTEVKIDGQEVLIINQNDILGVVG